jgi:DNA-binding SARP family transcriptional activator
MARLSLFLLGPFQVFLAGRPVTGFESARVRALLAYLAAESGRAHPRAAVAELLWPEQPHGVAAADLRHALATLRKTLEDQATDPPCLLITHETLQFNPVCDVFVDLLRFGACTNQAHLPTLEACQEAVNLYRGRFLEGFGLDHSPEFESWMILMRERIDFLAGQALARLVRHAAEQGDLPQAVSWTQQQLALQPWNEEVHQQLIWLLAHGGLRAAALHQYDVCVRMLATELGVEPQPATQGLAERIRAGRDDLGVVQGQDGKPLVVAVALRNPQMSTLRAHGEGEQLSHRH